MTNGRERYPVLPLTGIRVLDLTHGVAGPYATMLLGDLGCDVIKVEMPGRGDASRYMNVSDGFKADIPRVGGDYFLSINRNKRSLAIDLKEQRGRDVVVQLASRADLVVQNFRPGVVDRLGLGPRHLMAMNARLVYASISAYGEQGPLAKQPGMDVSVQARSGVMSITGPECSTEPVKPGVSLANFSGGVHLVVAILSALLQRHMTGKGSEVHVSLLDATMSMLMNYSVAVLDGAAEISRMGSGHPQLAPFEAVKTATGHVVIATGTNHLFKDLCRVLGRSDLTDDQRFHDNPSRVTNRSALIEELEWEFQKRTTDEWLAILETEQIPCAPVNSLKQAFEDPQFIANGMLRHVEHPDLGSLSQLGAPYELDNTLMPIRMPPPRLGEHSAEILTELGMESSAVMSLVSDGIVGLLDHPQPTSSA